MADPAQVDAVSAAMEEMRAAMPEDEGGEPQEPDEAGPVAEGEAVPAPIVAPEALPITPPAPGRAPVSLDDPLPEDEDLPPTLRGKASVRDLNESRKAAILQRDRMGEERNAIASRMMVLEKTLEHLAARLPQTQQPAAPAPPTTAEEIQRRGFDSASIIADPVNAVATAAQIETQKQMAPVVQELERLRTKEQGDITRQAYWSAAAADRDPQRWKSDEFLQTVADYVQARGLKQTDPQSYRAAAEHVDRLVGRFVPPAPVAPVATPVAAPTAPAPPVGGGPAATQPAAPPTKRHSGRDAENIRVIQQMFNSVAKKRGISSLSDDDMAKIGEEVENERGLVRRRSA